MAYMVAHTEKRKAGDLGGYQTHIDRKTTNHANKDIDIDKSHLNYDLVGHKKSISFKKEILDYINENKSTKRAIRKDAVVLQDWVISSSNSFFDNLTPKQTRRYFEVALQFFQDRFGKENVRFATVHMDELTPHLHLGIVPFNAYKKLTAKTIFNRECLRKIQDDLPKWFQSYGFDIERGKEKSDAKHIHPEIYKQQFLQAESEVKEQNFELIIDQLVNVVEDLPEAESEDFLETSKLIDTLTNDVGEIDYGKMKNRQFYQFIQVIFTEIKQFFARMSQKLAVKGVELSSRENILSEKEKALEVKLDGLNVKEQKIEKIMSGIENKDILITANRDKINEIQRNILDAKKGLMKWQGIEGGVNRPNNTFKEIADLGFRNGGKWTEEEQAKYYNYLNFNLETFEEMLDLDEMPWKPEEIAIYGVKQEAKLEACSKTIAEFGELLSEVSQEIQESKEMRGPRL